MITDVLKRKIYKSEINDFSSQKNDIFTAQQAILPNSYWSTNENSQSEEEYIQLDFLDNVPINYIEILAPTKSNPGEFFPEKFIFLISNEGSNWKVIHTDNDVYLNKNQYSLSIPLIKTRYLKIIIPKEKNDSKKHFEIGRIDCGIKGITAIKANRSAGQDFAINRLTDSKPETYWKADPLENQEKFTINADLGEIYQISSVSLTSCSEKPLLFPEDFAIELSTDKKLWMTTTDQRGFHAESNERYIWNTNSINARYVRIEMQGVKTEDGKYSIKLADLGIYAAIQDNDHVHVSSDNPSYATIFQPGIVRLAKDGETSRDAVIKASDIRLKDANTIFKGIVRFAADGESEEMLAVQSSDSRLQHADEIKEGIVRLAYDRETKQGTAVQGSDSRLKEATDKSFGIVKLCPHGEYSEMGVVKGSDPRLKSASIHAPGIVKLSSNGGTEPDTAVQGSDKRLKDATTTSKGIMQFADDKESEAFKAVQSNDTRLQPASIHSKGIVELAEMNESSSLKAVQSNDPRLQPATLDQKGIVELAENNEVKPGAVVQSNDDRLRKATTSYEGIMKFAEHGETSVNTAVQSSDPRLKDATTVAKGIVELAEDGEDSEGVAVQGNDKRLKTATTSSKGIVELAEDGENSEGVVVQGNDRRLRDATISEKGIMRFADNLEVKPFVAVQANDERLLDATENNKGIMQFAENGEVTPSKAVQSNDKRLKDASETAKGILQFAQDGEATSLKAVQSNDKRLKDATTVSKGIVELAEDGEESEGVVVQGNDKRLKKADEDNWGIIKLAKNNQKQPELAVQANDDRLFDKREPLPHEHDYAEKKHEYSSHTGFISISGEKHQAFQGLTPPVNDSSIIYSKNESPNEGAIGISGIATGGNSANRYGILGHSDFIGIRGQSNSEGNEENGGCGILGVSRFGAGGVFASEQNYSLIIDGFGNIDDIDSSVKMIGNGKALSVRGESTFDGQVNLNPSAANNNENPANIVEYFESDEAEYISTGDIVIASHEGACKIGRTQKAYDTRVCGIVSGNPAVVINNTDKTNNIYPIALSGKILCKVDARENPIMPGDLIVTASTPGCGMKGQIDSFEKVGSVIGKALEPLKEGIGTISVLIFHA